MPARYLFHLNQPLPDEIAQLPGAQEYREHIAQELRNEWRRVHPYVHYTATRALLHHKDPTVFSDSDGGREVGRFREVTWEERIVCQADPWLPDQIFEVRRPSRGEICQLPRGWDLSEAENPLFPMPLVPTPELVMARAEARLPIMLESEIYRSLNAADRSARRQRGNFDELSTLSQDTILAERTWWS